MLIRRYPTIEKYIVLEFSFSFLVSFLFYFLIFFLNQLLLMAQDILAKGIPIGSVLLLVLYALPSFLTLSTPFATLNAALMTYGRFASDNEVLAMRSAGLRHFMVFRPILMVGILIALLSFGINDFLLPAGTKAFQRLWLELSLTNPGLELDAYSIRTFNQSTLVSGAIDEEGIHPMLIIEQDNNGNRNSIISRLAAPMKGRTAGQSPGFRMHDVFSLIPDSRNPEEWAWATADSMNYRPFTSSSSTVLDHQTGPAEMRTKKVWEAIKEMNSQHNQVILDRESSIEEKRLEMSLLYADLASAKGIEGSDIELRLKSSAKEIENLESIPRLDYSLQSWKIEFYQKFAIPFACIPFVVLAFPLGVSAKRSGRAVGFFIGLLLTSVYWSTLVLGRSLGFSTGVSPFLLMIVPELLLLGVGIFLFTRRSHI